MWIDPGEPTVTPLGAKEATLRDLFEEAFTFESTAVMYWNSIPVRLSYKYDLSVMMPDIESVADEIQLGQPFTVHWPSDTFSVSWSIVWEQGRLRIVAHWDSALGECQALLNERSIVLMRPRAFSSEWRELLVVAHRTLVSGGYSKNDCDEWGKLEELIAAFDPSSESSA